MEPCMNMCAFNFQDKKGRSRLFVRIFNTEILCHCIYFDIFLPQLEGDLQTRGIKDTLYFCVRPWAKTQTQSTLKGTKEKYEHMRIYIGLGLHIFVKPYVLLV